MLSHNCGGRVGESGWLYRSAHSSELPKSLLRPSLGYIVSDTLSRIDSTMTSANRPDHDARYHRLFSDPRVVAQLLRDFVGGSWLAELDLDGMERLSAKFHAEAGQRREGDVIWAIPHRSGGTTYLILLLEFQSTSDHYMALRLLTYAGLLGQQLVKERRHVVDGKLPPLLPVVLYNGDTGWGAPLSMHDLVDLPEASPLWCWQPDMRYYLIDVGALDEAELKKRDSLPALWFRLENASDPAQVVAVADALIAWLAQRPGFEAARALFVELLGATMAPRDPDFRIPADLLEVRTMLATRAEQWQQEWLQAGRQEGRQEGEAALLLRQLARRFGDLPPWVRDRVLGADTATLDDWGMLILDATSLEDVVGER